MASSEVEGLFALAAIGLDDEDQPSGANPTGRFAVIRLIRLAGREVLDAALAECASADSVRRRVGVAVLGQLGHSEPGFVPVFVQERLAGLLSVLDAERNGDGDPQLLSEVCIGLGQLGEPKAIPTVLSFKRHPDVGVRYGVAMGLGGFLEPEAIDGLIELSADVDDEVRDWATFGLGLLVDTDTPAIRDALRARLDDPCPDVRNEAIEGLARRADFSVLPALTRELQTGVALPLLEAATALASSELCDALAAAAEAGLVWDEGGVHHDLTAAWNEARQACGCSFEAL